MKTPELDNQINRMKKQKPNQNNNINLIEGKRKFVS